jgi:hypothetical protein
MDRRNFLKSAATGIGLAGIGYLGGVGFGEVLSDIVQAVESQAESFLAMLKSDKAATPEGAIEICLKADALADSIEPLYPEQFRNLSAAQMFVYEVAPYAVYERVLPAETNYGVEGTSDRIMLPTRELLPEVTVIHYGGDSSFHLLGTAPCYNPDGGFSEEAFNVNIRYFNPMSPLYHRASSQISVLIHELLHMEGICTQDNAPELNKDVEMATQVATLEVLAAMTNHGNIYGLLPFVREIQGYAADVVYLWALENDNMDFYRENILHYTVDNAFRLAGFEKSIAHWQETYASQFRLKEILERYGVKPYHYVLEALRHPKYETRKLPFPNNQRTICLSWFTTITCYHNDLGSFIKV